MPTKLELELFLDTIIENIPNMVFIKDGRELRFVRFNRAGEELLGHRREALLGKNDYDFFPPAQADFFTSKDREVLASGKVLDIPEETINTQRLGPRTLHTRKIGITGPDGEKYLLGISEDITELVESRRKIVRMNGELQQRAAEIEERLDFSLEAAQLGVWDWDLVTGVIHRSKEHERLFETEASGNWDQDRFLAAIHEDDRAGVAAAIGDCLSSGADLHQVFRVPQRNESFRWVMYRGRIKRDENGRPARMSGIVADIDAIKNAENGLADSEARFRAIFDHAALGMAMAGLDGTFLKVNETLCRIVGYSSEELLEKTFQDITFPTDLSVDLTLLAKLVAGEVPSYSLDKRYIRKDQSIVWINLTASVVRDAAGKPLFFVAAIQDIDQKKRTEASLRDAELVKDRLTLSEQAAREASRLKSAFLANMSHEIRTPIHGILGMTDFLRTSVLSAEQKDYVENIGRLSETLLSLVNDVLDISKVEAGKLEFESLDFDIGSILSELELTFALSALRKGLRLTVERPADGSSWYKGDPIRLRQVLTNLLSNAIKFTDSGSVVLKMTVEERGETADRIFFVVEDTGIGVSEATRRRLFQAFTQADASTTRRFGGSGLGLCICKNLVELMGGSIGMTSREDEGSRFWFALPLPHGKPAKTASLGRRAAGVKPRRARILIAEDNPVNRDIALVIVRELGYTADSAENGREALEALQRHTYDLVLMDCQMPEMDGYQATREIRRREGRRDRRLPVIGVTANAFQHDKEKCFESGMDDYLPKPFKAEELERILTSWLPGGSVDLAVIDRLRTLQSPSRPRLLKQLIETFFSSAGLFLSQLNEAIEAKNAPKAADVAHTLKSSSASLGASHMSRLCAAIERADGEEQLSQLNEELRAEYSRVKSELMEIAG